MKYLCLSVCCPPLSPPHCSINSHALNILKTPNILAYYESSTKGLHRVPSGGSPPTPLTPYRGFYRGGLCWYAWINHLTNQVSYFFGKPSTWAINLVLLVGVHRTPPPFTPLPPIVGSNGGYCVSWPDHRSFLYFWKVLKAADAKTRPPETLTKADFKLFSARNNLFRQPQLFKKKIKILKWLKTHFS